MLQTQWMIWINPPLLFSVLLAKQKNSPGAVCHRWQTLQSAWTRGEGEVWYLIKVFHLCFFYFILRLWTVSLLTELFHAFYHQMHRCGLVALRPFDCQLPAAGHSRNTANVAISLTACYTHCITCWSVNRTEMYATTHLFTILFIKINIRQVGQLLLGNKESLPVDLTLSNKVSYVVRTYLWLAPGYQIV